MTLKVGDLAPTDIAAPKAISFESDVQTAAARQAARDAVEPQYDFTSEKAIAIAAEQALAFERKVSRVDSIFVIRPHARGPGGLPPDRPAGSV